VLPESNHTSMMSLLLVYCSASAAPITSAALSRLQASTPPAATTSIARSMMAIVSGCSSPLSLCRKKGSGTPQLRWRLMHQSGRLAIMSRKRARPLSGKKAVASMAASAVWRSVFGALSLVNTPVPSSMRMNHCAAAR